MHVIDDSKPILYSLFALKEYGGLHIPFDLISYIVGLIYDVCPDLLISLKKYIMILRLIWIDGIQHSSQRHIASIPRPSIQGKN